MTAFLEKVKSNLEKEMNKMNDDTTLEEKVEIFEQYDSDLENKIESIIKIDNDSISSLNDSFFQDLEIFEDHLQDESKSILCKIDKTDTLFGKVFLKDRLRHPTFDIKYLNRQKQNIIKINDNFEESHKLIDNMKGYEKDVIWLWKDIDEQIDSLYDMFYFKNTYLKLLNYNEWYLLVMNIYKIFIAPGITIISPLSTIIFMFVAYKYYKLELPFGELLKLAKKLFFNQFSSSSNLKMFFSMAIWIFFYFQGVYQTFNTSIQLNKICNIFHTKINLISSFIKNNNELYNFKTKIDLELLHNELDYKKLLKLLNRFPSDVRLISNKGGILSCYYTLLEIKDELKPFILFLSEMDYYNSLSKLYNEFQLKDNKYSLPNFIEHKNIKLKLMKCWNPYLDDNPVTNDIDIKKNIVITGPNAAGKSTFIKTILLNTVLSQTISLSPSEMINITPFEVLNSYLHIPDNKGKESLYEAEMNRSIDYIEQLKNNKDLKSLIIMDELFSSTNSIEGLEASKIVCKKMAKYKNNLTLLTTHYYEMSTLEKESKRFKNYKFEIKRDKNKKIVFTYRLKEGASKDYIALELFENKLNKKKN
jgi:DNA mismatch repair ATPase MutS